MSLAADALEPQLERIQLRALIVGGAGLVLTLVLAYFRPRELMHSYLAAYLFWVGLALGSIGLTMIHHLTGGNWGYIIRRPMEAGGMTLLPLAVLFLPVLIGIQYIYPWTAAQKVWPTISEELHHLLVHKRAYLNLGGFIGRAAGYFVLWILFAFLLYRWSEQQDRTEDLTPTRRTHILSAPGLVLLFLTGTFAAIDWTMSLEPDWYSSLFAPIVLIGWCLEAFAAMMVIAALLSDYEPYARGISAVRVHDVGKLMLAFVMLWAYMSFSQFLIIWSGNLVEEIPWYLRRTRGGWQWFAIALILFHFFMPFFLLLGRELKRNLRSLAPVAAFIVLIHAVDLAWLVLPSLAANPLQPYFSWVALLGVPVALLAIGGIWVAAFTWFLKGKPLLPAHDPDIDLNKPEHGSISAG